MKNILPAFFVVLALGLSAFYFTSKKPVVEAEATQTPTPEKKAGQDGQQEFGSGMTKEESQLVFTLYRRLQNLEKSVPEYKVPEDLKLIINGVKEE